MISLCITNYNRYEMLLESFAQVLNDDRIREIVIVDDCSTDEIYGKVLAAVFDMPKVKLYRNQENLGMSLNKKRAVELAKFPWVILFDSDNVINTDYLDAIPPKLYDNTIYCPSFAKPQFDYRAFECMEITRENAPMVISDRMGECLFNTANYLVPRDHYLSTYQHNAHIDAADTIHFNHLWIAAGNILCVVPNMHYQHRVHDGSGFLRNVNKNMIDAREIKELIKQL